MSVIWSHFEVCWETEVARLNRFFDNRIAMEEYGKYLADQPFTLLVVTLEHTSPHHGPTTRTILKGDEHE